jgi:hypothetical protein
MTIQILNTGNLSSVNGVKALVYAGSGVGKTRLAVTAPRPIIFSAERGLLSVKRERMPYIQIDSYKTLEEAVIWGLKSSEARKFDTFCLDSISEIAEVVLFDEQAKNKDPRKSYPAYQSNMMDMFRAFRDMPQKHIYFIAKESAIKSAEGLVKYQPSFPGNKLPEAAPYFFDEVFRLVAYTDPATQVVSRALRTQADAYNEGKDRSGALALWEPPDLGVIFRKIMAA